MTDVTDRMFELFKVDREIPENLGKLMIMKEMITNREGDSTVKKYQRRVESLFNRNSPRRKLDAIISEIIFLLIKHHNGSIV